MKWENQSKLVQFPWKSQPTLVARSPPHSYVLFKGFEQVKQGLEQVKQGLEQVKQGLEQVKQVFHIFLFLRYKTNKTFKNKWLNAEMIVY